MMRMLLTLVHTDSYNSGFLKVLMTACLLEASGGGLARFVRYSPEGTVYSTYGTTCWEALRAYVIYQS